MRSCTTGPWALNAGGHQVVLVATGDSTASVTRVRTSIGRSRPEDAGSASVELVHVLDAYEALHDVDLVHDHTIIGPPSAPTSAPRRS
ncbi:hypothetical protein [Pseudonocardia nigra]|uniref:hypothetical protein n=1 Tax=Pseudonocardia nigra TaxID=1921578 RepID=UPI001C5D5EB0|nr:hypothetical protein [Pseudonocardia nigra]